MKRLLLLKKVIKLINFFELFFKIHKDIYSRGGKEAVKSDFLKKKSRPDVRPIS